MHTPPLPPPPPPKPTGHIPSRPQSHDLPPLQASPSTAPLHNYTSAPAVMPPSPDRVGPEPPAIEDGWVLDVLKDKSSADLEFLLSNEPLLRAISHLHPSYSASQSHIQSTLDANKSLALHLKERESQVTMLRESTEALLLQYQSLDLAWRRKQTEVDVALAPWSPQALYQRLAALIAEQDAIVRAVEESFLESSESAITTHGIANEREVADWVKRLRAEGSRLELRKEFKARWDEGRVGGWR